MIRITHVARWIARIVARPACEVGLALPII
jgi:hypothetical protein